MQRVTFGIWIGMAPLKAAKEYTTNNVECIEAIDRIITGMH